MNHVLDRTAVNKNQHKLQRYIHAQSGVMVAETETYKREILALKFL